MGQQGSSAADRDLVLRFQSGDEDAYNEVYDRYHARVAAVCLRYLGNPQDAEEAAQETFVRAYQALTRFNGDFQLGAWLARIASNVSIDLLRARRRAEDVRPPAPVPGPGPEELVTGGEPRVAETLNELRPLHARALLMRDVEGLSHADMAGHLSMTPAQVKALLHRARTSFKRAWGRAGGWFFGPFAGLSARSDNTPQAETTVLAATPAVPQIVEKVAASAAVIALVFVTVPPANLPPSESKAPSGPGTRKVERRATDDVSHPRAAARIDTARPETSAIAAPQDDSLLRSVTGTVDEAVDTTGGGGGNGGGGGSGGTGGVSQATVEEKLRQVAEAASELAEDALP